MFPTRKTQECAGNQGLHSLAALDRMHTSYAPKISFCFKLASAYRVARARPTR